MMAFRVVRRGTVHYLDTPLEPQFHKPSRLWQPGRLTGDSPDTRRTLAVDNFHTPGRDSSLHRAYNDCPDCSKKAAAGGDPAQAQAPPANPPLPPPAYAPQQPPPPAQHPYYQQPPPQKARPQGYYAAQAQPAQPYYPQQPQAPPQPHYPQQPQPQAPPPGYYPMPSEPGRKLNLPVWLMTVIFAVGIVGVVFGIVSLLSTNRGSEGNGPAPIAAVESPAAKPGAKTN